MRKLLALVAVAALALTGCGKGKADGDGDARKKGEAAINSINLPGSWRRTDQRFYAADMNRSENEWDQVWRIDPPTTVTDAAPVFDQAAAAAGWTKLRDGHWSKSPYWMRSSVSYVNCGQQLDCTEISLTVVDVKPSWG